MEKNIEGARKLLKKRLEIVKSGSVLPKEREFDVIVVGGGPSGSSCATYLGRQGKKVLLLDRAKFPRDKICGDGISGKSVKILKELGIYEHVGEIERYDMYGITFSSPKGTVVEVPSTREDRKPPGFVCRRFVFDNFLFQNAKKYAVTIEEFFVSDLVREGEQVVGVKGTYAPTNTEMEFRAKVVVGADGVGGIVARKTGCLVTDDKHNISAVRAYYKGITGMNDKIELHFVDEVIPGYFWIFPLPGGRANVGAGMLVEDMKKKKVNLQKAMFNTIENNKLFKERFGGAERISEVKSWFLPVGSKRWKSYGNGFILVGDAASLIDPFSGEGIGNALVSGKIAAETIVNMFQKNDFSEAGLSLYEKELSKEVDKELQTSYKLQRLGQHTWLINLIIDKAAKSKYAREAISSSLIDPSKQDQFSSPLFYLKVLFS